MASKNARTHGILSWDVLIPGEQTEELSAFRGRMRDHLAPEGELEEFLADRVVSSVWRLRRLLRVETARVWAERRNYRGETGDEGDTPMSFAVNGDVIGKLSRYEVMLERGLYRALHELQRLQAVRTGEHVPAPVAVDVDLHASGGAP